MKVFDLTKQVHGQQAAHTIWGMAQITVPQPANQNGIWRK